MGRGNLRIGEIPYANLFPIFYTLKRDFDCSAYEFVEGAPSKLNKMLRDGAIDVSPSSSIEYLRHPSLYDVVEGHSISSKGPVGSILFFSKRPIEEGGRCVVHVSSQSETSVGLLHIILTKYYGAGCSLRVADDPQNAGGDAFLLIGDDALKYGKRHGERGTGHVYDLGQIWYQRTGLPFVFALWIVRRESGGGTGESSETQQERRALLEGLIGDLRSAKERALRNLPEIARHSPLKTHLSEEEILAYWDNLDYELTEEHRRGLSLFDQYLRELSCL